MTDLALLITRVVTGDVDAFTAIVHRFQDMAVGLAYAALGDRQLAEEAAQEAFINAYYDLAAEGGDSVYVTRYALSTTTFPPGYLCTGCASND